MPIVDLVLVGARVATPTMAAFSIEPGRLSTWRGRSQRRAESSDVKDVGKGEQVGNDGELNCILHSMWGLSSWFDQAGHTELLPWVDNIHLSALSLCGWCIVIDWERSPYATGIDMAQSKHRFKTLVAPPVYLQAASSMENLLTKMEVQVKDENGVAHVVDTSNIGGYQPDTISKVVTILACNVNANYETVKVIQEFIASVRDDYLQQLEDLSNEGSSA
ncbi:uncharacterized protein UDID_18399 [Ustilago sp. UG-2017a]|nr:uncharacterized protein UDID_18399 [Ustilago sp. UG-2017a]